MSRHHRIRSRVSSCVVKVLCTAFLLGSLSQLTSGRVARPWLPQVMTPTQVCRIIPLDVFQSRLEQQSSTQQLPVAAWRTGQSAESSVVQIEDAKASVTYWDHATLNQHLARANSQGNGFGPGPPEQDFRRLKFVVSPQKTMKYTEMPYNEWRRGEKTDAKGRE